MRLSRTPTATSPEGSVHPWLVRSLGLVGLVLAAPFATADLPRTLPGYALGVEAILRGERYAVALLGWTVLLVYLGRLVIEGRLPTKISTTGGEWNATAADAQLSELTVTVKRLQATIHGPDLRSGLAAQHDELWAVRRATRPDDEGVQ